MSNVIMRPISNMIQMMEYIERINHIGSTSVNGLLAKPVIDILLAITEDCDLKFLVSILEKNGYTLEIQVQKLAPHMMFMKGYIEKGFTKKRFIFMLGI
ncbi:GrpB family protein [Bacillus paramycoides]|uniref:GrpB family protein n=1 Tax=Bacillus paramycoides TaxID=2026194 RepID=UPI002E1EE548|nr:GrpB family protein [Bacillus paramycoides]